MHPSYIATYPLSHYYLPSCELGEYFLTLCLATHTNARVLRFLLPRLYLPDLTLGIDLLLSSPVHCVYLTLPSISGLQHSLRPGSSDSISTLLPRSYLASRTSRTTSLPARGNIRGQRWQNARPTFNNYVLPIPVGFRFGKRPYC